MGRYVVRERLGEGGFAEVYIADQEEPVRRRVAVKIIKPGMDTKQVIARFEAERLSGIGRVGTAWRRVMKRIFYLRPVGSSAFAALLLLLVIAAEAPGQNHQDDLEAAVEHRVIPVLPQAHAQRVAKLEAQIEALRQQGKYTEASRLAQQILALRQKHQTGWADADGKPAEWYEVGDARRAIEDLRLLASLSPEKLAGFVEAYRVDRRAGELFVQGRYAEAGLTSARMARKGS